MIGDVVERWHRFITAPSAEALEGLLADDVAFYSPIVYTPQRGRDVTSLYLLAAVDVLRGDDGGAGAFRYTKQVVGDDVAMLEFETTIDGTYVNGIDIIRSDDAGRIVELRVMLRPLRAVNLVHDRMRTMLESMQA